MYDTIKEEQWIVVIREDEYKYTYIGTRNILELLYFGNE